MTDSSQSYLEAHRLRGRELLVDVPAAAEEVVRAMSPDEDRAGVALVKQPGMNVVLTAFRAGAETSEHSPRGVIAMQVLEGQIELRMSNRSDRVGAGQIAVVDVLEPHSLTALEDSIVLTTVSMFQESEPPGA